MNYRKDPLMRKAILSLSLPILLWFPSTAFATPAQELAASAGITVELAERDIVAQESAPAIADDLRTALGTHFGGVWFNNRSGRFVVPLPPEASKAAAKAVLDGRLASYPLVARTYAALETKQTALDAELQGYEANQQAATYLDVQHNAVKVLMASTLSSGSKANIKANAEPGVIVSSAKPSALVAQSASATCSFPFCMEGSTGVVRGGVRIGFGYNAYCTAGFIVHDYNRDYMLTAGHCNWYLGTWEPPYNAYRPQSASPSPCMMHDAGFHMDETGDVGLASLGGCEYSPALEVWPGEELAVLAKPAGNLSCLPSKPYCNDPIPADARPYYGQWVCHSGATSHTQCGEVSTVNMTITGSYPEGQKIPMHHLEYVYAFVEGGDSGGPMFARSGNHAVGQGVVSLGWLGERGVYAQELWYVKQVLDVDVGP